MIKCEFEDGGQANLRHVTVDAIIVQNDEILIIKRAKDDYVYPGKFALPGGYLDFDENTKAAVLREVKEETGYEAKIKECFFINDDPKRHGDKRRNVTFVYILEAGKQVTEPDHEVESIHWLKLSDINKDNFAFDHYQIIETYKKHLKNNYQLPIVGIDDI